MSDSTNNVQYDGKKISINPERQQTCKLKASLIIGDDKRTLIMLSASTHQANQNVHSDNKKRSYQISHRSSNLTREILPSQSGDKSDINWVDRSRSLRLQGVQQEDKEFASSNVFFLKLSQLVRVCSHHQDEQNSLAEQEVTA